MSGGLKSSCKILFSYISFFSFFFSFFYFPFLPSASPIPKLIHQCIMITSMIEMVTYGTFGAQTLQGSYPLFPSPMTPLGSFPPPLNFLRRSHRFGTFALFTSFRPRVERADVSSFCLSRHYSRHLPPNLAHLLN